MEKFIWTDESVKAFVQVYSSNFNSKLLKDSAVTYKNYAGKKIDEKVEQFKRDYIKPRGLYVVLLQFDTHKITYGTNRGQWVVRKEFNDLKHCNNFIDYICRKKGYSLDEMWYESGYPFQEGDKYYTIEDKQIVESWWDDESEALFDKDRLYFATMEDAEYYRESIV